MFATSSQTTAAESLRNFQRNADKFTNARRVGRIVEKNKNMKSACSGPATAVTRNVYVYCDAILLASLVVLVCECVASSCHLTLARGMNAFSHINGIASIGKLLRCFNEVASVLV